MNEIYEEYSYYFEMYGVSEEAISSFTDLEIEQLGDILKEYRIDTTGQWTTPKLYIETANIRMLVEDISQETREKFAALFEN